MIRDSKRSQVYAAEDLAGDQTVLSKRASLAELAEVATRLVSGSWWRQNFGHEPIRVVASRSLKQSTFDPAKRCISLSPAAHDLGTLSHELAHGAAFDRSLHHESHGPSFRALHVVIRRAILGAECGDDLAEVYAQFGLSVDSLDELTEPGPALLPHGSYNAPTVQGRPWFASESDRGPIAL